MPPTPSRRNVVILLFDDVEVLDFAGPFEIFAVTDELRGHDTFNVITAAESPASIRARDGLVVVPDVVLESCPTPHVLIIPGGAGTRRLMLKTGVLDWIAAKAKSAELVMSVCTGALVLGKINLLDGLRATIEWYYGAHNREEVAATLGRMLTERSLGEPALVDRQAVSVS